MDESTEELKVNMEKAFAERVEADQKLTALADHLNSGKGTYVTAEQYAYETGKVLSSVFREQITEEKLPEGVFTREFVQETIELLLKDDHKIVSTMAAVAQENINTAAGVHIQPQKADFNQDRADGFATKMDGKTMEEAGWMLGSPVTNFSQSIVDETMIKNGEVLAKAGKAATIKRQAEAKCCDWCLNKAGTYDATNREAYQRHRDCRCEIEMHLDGSVKRQSDWKKNQWQKVKDQIKDAIDLPSARKYNDAKDVDITGIQYADLTRNFAELKKFMKENYGISIMNSVERLDFYSVREGISGIQYILDEFPKARDTIKMISTKRDGIMCADYNGNIYFNPDIYKTRNDVLIEHNLQPGAQEDTFHPEGDNAFGTGAHEAAHILEKVLVDREYDGSAREKNLKWRMGEVAEEIVETACRDASKLPECKGLSYDDIIDQISDYAGKESNYHPSETLAEAVEDYALNGDAAKALSRVIWDRLKKELG